MCLSLLMWWARGQKAICTFVLEDYDISLHLLIVFYIVIGNPGTKTSKFVVVPSSITDEKASIYNGFHSLRLFCLKLKHYFLYAPENKPLTLSLSKIRVLEPRGGSSLQYTICFMGQESEPILLKRREGAEDFFTGIEPGVPAAIHTPKLVSACLDSFEYGFPPRQA